MPAIQKLSLGFQTDCYITSFVKSIIDITCAKNYNVLLQEQF